MRGCNPAVFRGLAKGMNDGCLSLCLCQQKSLAIITACGLGDGEAEKCEGTEGQNETSGASTKPPGNVVQGVGRVVRSPNRPSRSPRHRYSRKEREGAEPRRAHSRPHRRADRQRPRHHDISFGNSRAGASGPTAGHSVPLSGPHCRISLLNSTPFCVLRFALRADAFPNEDEVGRGPVGHSLDVCS